MTNIRVNKPVFLVSSKLFGGCSEVVWALVMALKAKLLDVYLARKVAICTVKYTNFTSTCTAIKHKDDLTLQWLITPSYLEFNHKRIVSLRNDSCGFHCLRALVCLYYVFWHFYHPTADRFQHLSLHGWVDGWMEGWKYLHFKK